jgi:Rps23 Pro-64 3,4-dihydroxylase Tpa1-like proline 4-hydroxylase
MIPIMLYDEFLVGEELQGLLGYSRRNASRFVQSEVTRYDGGNEQDSGHRRSRVLFDLGPYHALFQRRLMTFLPRVLLALGKQPFPVASLEIQLTASNHAEFFRAHTDNGDGELRGRELTFVYFFHREPRRFGGGELRIFDTIQTEGVSTATECYQLVYPRQNQIVFFPSSYLHEILPVVCPSRAFADSRFTVNGWVRR